MAKKPAYQEGVDSDYLFGNSPNWVSNSESVRFPFADTLRGSLERKAGANTAGMSEGAPTNLVVQGESVWIGTLLQVDRTLPAECWVILVCSSYLPKECSGSFREALQAAGYPAEEVERMVANYEDESRKKKKS